MHQFEYLSFLSVDFLIGCYVYEHIHMFETLLNGFLVLFACPATNIDDRHTQTVEYRTKKVGSKIMLVKLG